MFSVLLKSFLKNESEDLFFHFSDVAENDRDDLRKEHLVTFSIRYNERARKRNAFDVHLLPRHMVIFFDYIKLSTGV